MTQHHEVDLDVFDTPSDPPNEDYDPVVFDNATQPTPKRSMKQTTGYALGGYTIGTALAAIIVWILSQAGIDASDIAEPLGFVIQGLGVAFGGWAAPPTQQITE